MSSHSDAKSVFVLAAPRASPHVQRTSPGMMSRAMPAKTMNHQAAAGDAHQKNEELTAQVRQWQGPTATPLGIMQTYIIFVMHLLLDTSQTQRCRCS